jgi:hypothetical protein
VFVFLFVFVFALFVFLFVFRCGVPPRTPQPKSPRIRRPPPTWRPSTPP